MSIDWFTFTAQIINFLILVWLLSHFLYRPIINAMNDRQEQLVAEHNKAISAQQEAETVAATYRQKTDELAHAKDELLAEAGKEILQWKENHLHRARTEVDDAKTEWYHSLKREKEAFIREVRLLMANHVQQMSRRVLSEIANTEMQKGVIKTFMKNIGQIDEQQKCQLVSLLETSRHRVLVETAFPLDQSDRDLVTQFLHDFLGSEVGIDFEISTELICGMELHVAGYKIAWNINEPLEELEEEFVRTLNEEITLESVTDMSATT
ncbi:MAG: hypothetical protein KDA65_07265 [Planctomycetaceae bacterium]|nr:hypothetical protein [Planctomycetaceae bacterium]